MAFLARRKPLRKQAGKVHGGDADAGIDDFEANIPRTIGGRSQPQQQPMRVYARRRLDHGVLCVGHEVHQDLQYLGRSD